MPQGSPRAAQVQRPSTHCPGSSHCELVEHGSPIVPGRERRMVHEPPEQLPVQHCAGVSHRAPTARQTQTEDTPLAWQVPEQHPPVGSDIEREQEASVAMQVLPPPPPLVPQAAVKTRIPHRMKGLSH
jgi:hypothetical protein